MKRTFVFLLAAAMLCSSMAMPSYAETSTETSAAPAAASEDYTVTATQLYVRSGPGTTYDKLGSLVKGKSVSGTVKDGWLSFDYNGKTAYCSAQFLSEVKSAASLTTGKSGNYVVTASKLYVRSGPGTTYSELGTLAKGKTVAGTVKDGWISFTFNGKTGYCSSKFLKAQ